MERRARSAVFDSSRLLVFSFVVLLGLHHLQHPFAHGLAKAASDATTSSSGAWSFEDDCYQHISDAVKGRCDLPEPTGTFGLSIVADGQLLNPPCTAILGLSEQVPRTFLLNHTVYEYGGTYQVSRLVELYGKITQIPLIVTVEDPDWWNDASHSPAGQTALGPAATPGSFAAGAAATATSANNTGLGAADYAGWAVAPSTLSGMYDAGLLQPLDSLLAVSPELAAVWQDIPEVFRDTASVYDGKIVSIPYTAEVPLLFWRRDLFSQLGLLPPATWEETLALARSINGTQLPCIDDPAQQCQQAGFCFVLPLGCFYDGLALTTVWASMVGAYGTSSAGLYFDPVTMEPLFQGRGMTEALRIYRELAQLAPRTERACDRLEESFYMKSCMLGLSVTSLFKVFGFAFDGKLRGRLGVAMLPGSHLIQNRSTGELEPCTTASCPYATPVSSVVHNGTVLVNRVPYIGHGAFSLAINRQAPPNHALAALRAFTFALTYEGGWPLALDPTTRTAPVRTTHLSSANIAFWTNQGYEMEDTRAFLGVMADTMSHPCLAGGLRVSGAVELGAAVAEAATTAVYGNSTVYGIGTTAEGVIVKLLAARYQSWLRQYYGGNMAAFQRAYWRDIGYHPPPQPPPQPAQPAAQAGASHRMSPGAAMDLAAALATAGAVLVLAVAVPLLVRRWRLLQRRSNVWPVAAPGLSPDTSLCVTDIQSSTTLWEELDPRVMDEALSLHNSCIRGLLSKHQGYECHTEGDSFVIAFPTPACAVAFALEMQVALMQLPWPEDLLHCDPCAVVYQSAAAHAAMGSGVSTTAPSDTAALAAAAAVAATTAATSLTTVAGLGPTACRTASSLPNMACSGSYPGFASLPPSRLGGQPSHHQQRSTPTEGIMRLPAGAPEQGEDGAEAEAEAQNCGGGVVNAGSAIGPIPMDGQQQQLGQHRHPFESLLSTMPARIASAAAASSSQPLAAAGGSSSLTSRHGSGARRRGVQHAMAGLQTVVPHDSGSVRQSSSSLVRLSLALPHHPLHAGHAVQQQQQQQSVMDELRALHSLMKRQCGLSLLPSRAVGASVVQVSRESEQQCHMEAYVGYHHHRLQQTQLPQPHCLQQQQQRGRSRHEAPVHAQLLAPSERDSSRCRGACFGSNSRLGAPPLSAVQAGTTVRNVRPVDCSDMTTDGSCFPPERWRVVSSAQDGARHTAGSSDGLQRQNGVRDPACASDGLQGPDDWVRSSCITLTGDLTADASTVNAYVQTVGAIAKADGAAFNSHRAQQTPCSTVDTSPPEAREEVGGGHAGRVMSTAAAARDGLTGESLTSKTLMPSLQVGSERSTTTCSRAVKDEPQQLQQQPQQPRRSCNQSAVLAVLGDTDFGVRSSANATVGAMVAGAYAVVLRNLSDPGGDEERAKAEASALKASRPVHAAYGTVPAAAPCAVRAAAGLLAACTSDPNSPLQDPSCTSPSQPSAASPGHLGSHAGAEHSPTRLTAPLRSCASLRCRGSGCGNDGGDGRGFRGGSLRHSSLLASSLAGRSCKVPAVASCNAAGVEGTSYEASAIQVLRPMPLALRDRPAMLLPPPVHLPASLEASSSPTTISAASNVTLMSMPAPPQPAELHATGSCSQSEGPMGHIDGGKHTADTAPPCAESLAYDTSAPSSATRLAMQVSLGAALRQPSAAKLPASGSGAPALPTSSLGRVTSRLGMGSALLPPPQPALTVQPFDASGSFSSVLPVHAGVGRILVPPDAVGATTPANAAGETGLEGLLALKAPANGRAAGTRHYRCRSEDTASLYGSLAVAQSSYSAFRPASCSSSQLATIADLHTLQEQAQQHDQDHQITAVRRSSISNHVNKRISSYFTGALSATGLHGSIVCRHSSAGGGGSVASLSALRHAGSGAGAAMAPSHTGASVLCFRGFRVRVGVCTGLVPGRDVVYRKDLSGRMAYSGQCMQLTKLISDAALGGMVLLGASTVERLLPLPRRDLQGLTLWHKGRFELENKAAAAAACSGLLPIRTIHRPHPHALHPQRLTPARGVGPQDLYQALCGPSLAARQLLLERQPLRALGQVLPGVLAAPLGAVTLAMVQVVGLPVLEEWNEGVTRESLGLLRGTALELLRAAGGYPVVLDGGVLLAAFASPADAIRWLLSLEEELRLHVPWPEALLGHELGDELTVTTFPPPLQLQPQPATAAADMSLAQRGGSSSSDATAAHNGGGDGGGGEYSGGLSYNTSPLRVKSRGELETHSITLACLVRSNSGMPSGVSGIAGRHLTLASGGRTGSSSAASRSIGRARTSLLLKVTPQRRLQGRSLTAQNLGAAVPRVFSEGLTTNRIDTDIPGREAGSSGLRRTVDACPQPLTLPFQTPDQQSPGLPPASALSCSSMPGPIKRDQPEALPQQQPQSPPPQRHPELESQDEAHARNRPSGSDALYGSGRGSGGSGLPCDNSTTAITCGSSLEFQSSTATAAVAAAAVPARALAVTDACSAPLMALPGRSSPAHVPPKSQALSPAGQQQHHQQHPRHARHLSAGLPELPVGVTVTRSSAHPLLRLQACLRTGSSTDGPSGSPHAEPIPACLSDAPCQQQQQQQQVTARLNAICVEQSHRLSPTQPPPASPSHSGAAAALPQQQQQQQRCVLRGLRVRCAAVEGSFVQDGSVNAERLYRNQHGGKPYNRLAKLCSSALMGQVLCSWSVAKRVHRAAATGELAALQLRLTPQLAGSRKRNEIAAAGASAVAAADACGGDAEAMAAAAAAVAAAANATLVAGGVGAGEEDAEGCMTDGLASREVQGGGVGTGAPPPQQQELSRAEVWLCGWTRAAAAVS